MGFNYVDVKGEERGWVDGGFWYDMKWRWWDVVDMRMGRFGRFKDSKIWSM